MIDHSKVLWVPITTFEKLKADGKKSFHFKMIGEEEYPSFEIESVKKRVFLDSDYMPFYNRCKEKYERDRH